MDEDDELADEISHAFVDVVRTPFRRTLFSMLADSIQAVPTIVAYEYYGIPGVIIFLGSQALLNEFAKDYLSRIYK